MFNVFRPLPRPGLYAGGKIIGVGIVSRSIDRAITEPMKILADVIAGVDAAGAEKAIKPSAQEYSDSYI